MQRTQNSIQCIWLISFIRITPEKLTEKSTEQDGDILGIMCPWRYIKWETFYSEQWDYINIPWTELLWDNQTIRVSNFVTRKMQWMLLDSLTNLDAGKSMVCFMTWLATHISMMSCIHQSLCSWVQKLCSNLISPQFIWFTHCAFWQMEYTNNKFSPMCSMQFIISPIFPRFKHVD